MLRRCSMKIRLVGCVVLAFCASLVISTANAEDVETSPNDKIKGPFDVKAITGELKGKELSYVCKYNGEQRPAVVLIFSQKADENVAKLVKAVDAVQKNNAKLGT